MNLLSFSHAYAGAGHNGGAETTLHDLNRLLRREGHSVTALVSKPHDDGSGPYVLDGVKVQPHASKMDAQLYIPQYDAVISHLECSLQSGPITRKLEIPAIQLIHNDQDYCIKAGRYADAFIFNTEWVTHAYSDYDVPSAILHPIIDPHRYYTESTREFITLVNLTIGTSSKISYNKGAETFYEMARRFPNERFLGVKGGYGEQYVPHDLPPNVTIMEHTNNPLDFYSKSKVMLMPSKYESYGRIAVEAACSGIPTIATRTNGTLEANAAAFLVDGWSNLDMWECALGVVLEEYDHYKIEAFDSSTDIWGRTQIEWATVNKLLYSV